MTDNERYDWIERYLAGTLGPEEKLEFENQLKADAALQEALVLHRQAAETLRGEKIHQFRAALKKVDDNWQQQGPKKKDNIFRLHFRKIVAVAAAILALVAAFQVFSPRPAPTGESLFADNFEPYKMILNQRSADPEEGDVVLLMNEAVAAYELKNYKEASSVFQQLQAEMPDAEAFRFYAAIAELSLGNADAAISTLEEILKEAPPLLIEQSRWYLALAYLQKGDIQSVKSHLQDIQRGAFKYAEAQTILKLIQ